MRRLKDLIRILKQYRDHLATYATLGLSVVIAERTGEVIEVPSWFPFVTLGIVLFVAGRGPSPELSARQRLRGRLRIYGIASGVIGIVASVGFGPPVRFYLFAPVWLTLGELTRFVLQIAQHWNESEFSIPDTAWTRAAFRVLKAVTRAGARARIDLALNDAVLVAIVTLIGWHLVPQTWRLGHALALTVELWAAVNALIHLGKPHGLATVLIRSVASLGLLGAGFAIIFHRAGVTVNPGAAVAFGYACLAVLGARILGYRYGQNREDPIAETSRWMIIAGTWVLLFHPFFYAARHGTGDAQWYATMTADMIAQVRAGVFPVFAGQSEYQFNGAIYPLRVAPLFLYLDAFVDLATVRQLDAYGVQNLTLSLVGLLGFTAAYASLARILPTRRWMALFLAIVFIACPGTLGIVYNTDLYMSWTTLPFIPLVLFGLVRFFEEDGWETLVFLGGALGALWWGHSPIAMWTTLASTLVVAVRLALLRPPRSALRRYAAGAATFAAIAAYPVLSVLAFPVVEGVKPTSFQVATSSTIVMFLTNVFPKVLLPVSATGRALSDFQLGYSLWLTLVLCAVWVIRERSRSVFVMLVPAGILVVLLTPIPKVDSVLWSLVPALVRNTTGNWVMNRLYLVTDAFLVYAFALALRELVEHPFPRRVLSTGILILMSGWSLLEASKFAATDSPLLSRPERTTELNKENVMPTQFAYLVFPKLPSYFTHGVTNPELENRLLSASDRTLLVENTTILKGYEGKKARRVGSLSIGRISLPDGTPYVSNAPLVLEPGKHYLLQFDYPNPDLAAGILMLKGPTLFREYALPTYGAGRSFGIGGLHSTILPLETSERSPEPVSFQFVPDDRTLSEPVIARLSVYDYDPETLPVHVESWIPYRARVRAPSAAWLETPRLYQVGYRARLNGKPAEVTRSPEGLAMVAVPPGKSEVVISLSPPLLLQLTFWLSFLSGISLAGIALAWALRIPESPKSAPPPPLPAS